MGRAVGIATRRSPSRGSVGGHPLPADDPAGDFGALWERNHEMAAEIMLGRPGIALVWIASDIAGSPSGG